MRGHQHLAFRHRRGGEIEHHRLSIRPRKGRGERRRREAPLRASERRDESAARHIDEVHRDEPGLHGLFSPFADAPEMARAPKGDHGHPVQGCDLDAEPDRRRPSRLPEAVMAVENRKRLAARDDLGFPIGDEIPVSKPPR